MRWLKGARPAFELAEIFGDMFEVHCDAFSMTQVRVICA